MKRKFVSLTVCLAFLAMLAVPVALTAIPSAAAVTPTVTSIAPNSLGNGIGNKKAAVTINGSDFDPNAKAVLRKTDQRDIKVKIGSHSATEIVGTVNLKNAIDGLWDVVVINKGGETGTLAGGLMVSKHPVITSIATDPTPVVIGNDNVSLTINGSDFQSGVIVKLTHGHDVIEATDEVVDGDPAGTQIICHFDMQTTPPAHIGAWKVLVTNPDGGIHQAPTYKFNVLKKVLH